MRTKSILVLSQKRLPSYTIPNTAKGRLRVLSTSTSRRGNARHVSAALRPAPKAMDIMPERPPLGRTWARNEKFEGWEEYLGSRFRNTESELTNPLTR